jgi:hypothetical protein
VLDHHRFRLSCGSGRRNQVGQVAWTDPAPEILVGSFVGTIEATGTDDVENFSKRCPSGGRSEVQHGTGHEVGDDPPVPLCRIRRIEERVGGTGLESREHRYQEFRRAIAKYDDSVFTDYSHATQLMRQDVCPLVQLAI